MRGTVLRWRHRLAVTRLAKQVAAAAEEECWAKVRGKAAVLAPSEVSDFIRVHSTTAVHKHVDVLVRDNPSIDGNTGNQLIVKASERLVSRLVKRLHKQTRRTRRAA